MRIQWQSRRFLPDLYGGLEIRSCNLVKAWLAAGQQVSVLAEDYPCGRSSRRDEPIAGVPCVRIPSLLPNYLWRLGPALRCLRWARYQAAASNADVVVAAYPECVLSSKLRFPRRPVLYNCVNADLGELKGFERWQIGRLIALAAHRADHIVLASGNIRRQLQQLAPRLDARKISVVPHAADLDRFCNATPAPQMLGLRTGGECLILYAGRLSPEKGVDLAIEALRRMRQRERARLVVLGEGPAEPALREQARATEVNDRVHFLGRSEHAEAYIAAADVLVLPSRVEAFGTVLVEAMAAGVPCVSWRAGGAALVASDEIIEHGQTGLLAEPFHTDDLARCLDTLVEDAERRRCMGRAGQERAQAKFSLSTMAQAYLQLAERLQARRISGAREVALGGMDQ